MNNSLLLIITIVACIFCIYRDVICPVIKGEWPSEFGIWDINSLWLVKREKNPVQFWIAIVTGFILDLVIITGVYILLINNKIQ